MGSDAGVTSTISGLGSFNSRSRMGSDPTTPRSPSFRTTFQFALPHGERPSSTPPSMRRCGFQFALPHGERPSTCRACTSPVSVSIRAPAWGATKGACLLCVCPSVSIRAPAWGATIHRCHFAHLPNRFNSRSRMGSDPCGQRCASTAAGFQFALPHGERPRLPAAAMRKPCFNSRSRMGSDH